MNATAKRKPPWLGFLVGLLAVVLPLGGYLLYQQRTGEVSKPETPKAGTARPAAEAPRPVHSQAPSPRRGLVPFPIDEAGLRVAGASLPDAEPPPDAAAIDRALRRTEGWLRQHTTDPFSGSGTDSLRLFTLEVQSWDRLWLAESDPARKAILEEETRRRLRLILDPVGLASRFREQGNLQGLLEVLILAARCPGYGIDPSPLAPTLEVLASSLERSLERMPGGIVALYASQLALLGIAVGPPLDRLREQGVLARRPREITMTLSDVYGLTHEIFAYTDLAHRPLEPLSARERGYLHRVLPQLALTYTVLRNPELSADLASCLALAGMTETYGYREGLRFLLGRQNEDGSFGPATQPRAARFATTVSCLTALSLERQRQREERE